MVLPRVDVPSYELTLPSTDKKVKYRPFLVKEEKILYIALESKDNKEMVNALKEIVDACTFNTLNISSLPLFDIEYIFLNIRAKSIGEIANFKVICPDDGKTYTEVNIDLTKVEVHVNDDHTNKILIDKKRNLGLVLKYPTLSTYVVGSMGIVGEEVNTKNFETIFSILVECVDHIFEGEKIYPAKDVSADEMKEFLENLPQEAFTSIKKFFDTLPKLKHEVEVENPKTKVKSKITFEGLQDFFV